MAHLNQYLLLDIEKNSTMSYSIIKSKFFVWFASKHGDKWASICDQNGIKCQYGRFVGRFHYNILDNWISTKANLCLE